MENPWLEISLSDYENHMGLESVSQLQTLNKIMENQICFYDVESAMILGVAGGNGLEHVEKSKVKKLYGIDINGQYLKKVAERYSGLGNRLKLLNMDITNTNAELPSCELVIANLFIEYVGYENFVLALSKISPKIVSCVIQIDSDKTFVSDSPYIHSFDSLDKIHQQINVLSLCEAMAKIGFHMTLEKEESLPNGKKLVRLDYMRLCE